MPILLQCPNCHHKMASKDASPGQRKTCSECGQLFEIPDDKSSTDRWRTPDELNDPLGISELSDDTQAVVGRPLAAPVIEEDNRPAAAAAPPVQTIGRSKPLFLIGWIGGGAVLIAAVIFLVIRGNKSDLEDQPAPLPPPETNIQIDEAAAAVKSLSRMAAVWKKGKPKQLFVAWHFAKLGPRHFFVVLTDPQVLGHEDYDPENPPGKYDPRAELRVDLLRDYPRHVDLPAQRVSVLNGFTVLMVNDKQLPEPTPFLDHVNIKQGEAARLLYFVKDAGQVSTQEIKAPVDFRRAPAFPTPLNRETPIICDGRGRPYALTRRPQTQADRNVQAIVLLQHCRKQFELDLSRRDLDLTTLEQSAIAFRSVRTRDIQLSLDDTSNELSLEAQCFDLFSLVVKANALIGPSSRARPAADPASAIETPLITDYRSIPLELKRMKLDEIPFAGKTIQLAATIQQPAAGTRIAIQLQLKFEDGTTTYSPTFEYNAGQTSEKAKQMTN